MALVPCPECQGEVSSNASSCPRCGQPIATGAAPHGESPVPAAKELRFEIRPLRLVIGLALIGVGLYAALEFIPAHDRSMIRLTDFGSVARALDPDTWYLNSDYIGLLRAMSWGVFALGVMQVVLGSMTRRGGKVKS